MSLSNKDEIVIKKADEGSNVILQNKKDYLGEALM